MAGCPITESTPLINPYWEYSRKKIDAEEVLTAAYRRNGFPVTIVRPSHTYDGKKPPVAIHGDKGNWQILKRILEGKPIIIPGDGTSLWPPSSPPKVWTTTRCLPLPAMTGARLTT